MQRIFRATSLALALSLGWLSGAEAGPSASAVLSQSSAATAAGIGPGATVSISIDVTGAVDTRNVTLFLQVSDPAAFDMGSMHLEGDGAFADLEEAPGPGELVSGSTDVLRQGLATFSGAVSGDGSVTVTIKTSADFTVDTEAGLTVTGLWLGVDPTILTDPTPDATVHDLFGADDVNATLQINPPVTDPTLTASTATDVSLDFSEVGTGSSADGSAGEVSLGTTFRDASGAAAGGQSVTWTVTNNGAESIYILGASATMVAAGATTTVAVTTAADGSAGITIDAEGDKLAGSTSASITASTTANNTDGVAQTLSVSFSVTWDVPVPAELASFTADVVADQAVLLQWATASQTNNLGWEVYRSVDNHVFERISSLISGEGTTDEFRQYSFTDQELPVADVVYYYLRQTDLNGTTSRSSVIEVALAPTDVLDQALPLVTALDQNYPNPFNPETTIQFDLATDSYVSLRIYDTAGQVVRTLMQGSMTPGSYSPLWDGLNDSGARVGSGVYFYELRAGSFTSMKKMTLLR